MVELHHVLHVLNLQRNLLSIIYLTRSGRFNITISPQKMAFHKNGKLHIISGMSNNNSAFLEGDTINNLENENAMSVSTLLVNITLWHRRFGHYHYVGINEAITWKLVT